MSVTVSALVSGGKDSIYAAYLCDTQGWPVDELVTLRPTDPDSLLFHTPNLDLVALQAEAWGKRHRNVPVDGTGEAAELAALERALAGARGPIVAGAIESSYQWTRLLRVADRVGRRLYAPLWRKDPVRVVREEIAAGLDIRFVHLAAEPLSPDLLGQRLDLDRLTDLERRSATIRPVHVAGEGGEYETLVIDSPFFRSRIEWDAAESRVDPATAWLMIRSAHLKSKTAVRERPPD
jgi:diphthine-ammonia ligase